MDSAFEGLTLPDVNMADMADVAGLDEGCFDDLMLPNL